MTTDSLGPRGAALYADLVPEGASESVAAIGLEAARTADRLDDLDKVIEGKGLINLLHLRRVDLHGDGSEDSPIVIQLKFDNVLAEARQQAGALRQLLGSIEKAAPAASAPTAGAAQTGGGGLNELEQRRRDRAARRSAAAPS